MFNYSLLFACLLPTIFYITYFIFIGSIVESDDEIISSDGWANRGSISVSLVLSSRKCDGIVTINNEEITNDMEPTMIKGRKKPPILYNQAPVAGPKANEKIIHLRTYVHLGNSNH